MSGVEIKITKEDVLYVARRLRIELTDEQIEEVLENTKDILLDDEMFWRIVIYAIEYSIKDVLAYIVMIINNGGMDDQS
ncbi:MAG: hypothetical protein QXU63_00690 [Nitrososphaerota archaeon]